MFAPMQISTNLPEKYETPKNKIKTSSLTEFWENVDDEQGSIFKWSNTYVQQIEQIWLNQNWHE